MRTRGAGHADDCHVGVRGTPRRMETKDLIELLNDDLEREFQSIVQYVQHVAIISGAEYTSTVEELR